jgi:hypothetical protein
MVHRFGKSRQDRFHPTVVTRCGFSRPEAPSIERRRAALAPAFRPAIAHPSPPGFPADCSLGFLGAHPRAGFNERDTWVLGSSSPLAPRGTSGRRIAKLRTCRAPLSDATFTHDCTSSGLAPVHRDPQYPYGHLRLREGLLWVRAAYRLLQRDYSIRAHPRASRPRPPRAHAPLARSNDPLAFAQRSPSRSAPLAARRGSTTQSGFAKGRQRLATPAEVQPRTGRPGAKGPQPFGLFADLPPPKPAEHPFVANTLPPEPGVVRSRLTWPIAPSFPG